MKFAKSKLFLWRIGLFIVTGFCAIMFLRHFFVDESVDSQPMLMVYSYPSFVGPWGPGPELKKIFESTCACKLQFIDAGEGGILLERLRAEQNRNNIDVVIGIDQFALSAATNNFDFLNIDLHDVLFIKDLPVFWHNVDGLVPFDWSPLTFVSCNKTLANKVTKLDDLLRPELAKKIIIQDPRTSSPGLHLLFWILQAKGVTEGFNFWQKLFPHVYAVTSSWSEAYGIFQQGSVDFVFSYLTSPVYHWREKDNPDCYSLVFQEQHPFQIEFAGVLATSKQVVLSEQFVRFLLSAQAQNIIMQQNIMLPVVANVSNGSMFEKLPKVDLYNPEALKQFMQNKNHYLRQWSEIRRGF